MNLICDSLHCTAGSFVTRGAWRLGLFGLARHSNPEFMAEQQLRASVCCAYLLDVERGPLVA